MDAPPPPPPPPPPPAAEAPPAAKAGPGRSVALLLAASAAVAALVAGRAALAASAAGDSYQAAVRAETKRGAALVEDVRHVYASEAPAAFRHAGRVALAEEVRAQADQASGILRQVLVAEADVHDAIATAGGERDILGPKYLTDAGAYDVEAYLADLRAAYPDLVAIDPATDVADGDEASERARRGMLATVPVAFAFLAGAMAQSFPGRRRALVSTGFALLVVAAVAAVAVEVL